jgi:hypothetical protein
MSKSNASSLLAVAASLLFGSYWVDANAGVVTTTSSSALEHTYGRAGVPIASDEIAQARANEQSASVGVSYSADLAQWTNMPRDQAHEGPVTDGLQATDTHSVEHWFGRAGGPVGADEVASPHSMLSSSAAVR